MQRYVKVCSVGLVGTIVQLLIFNLLRQYCHPTIANGIGIECAIVTNFFLNHYFSFQDRRQAHLESVQHMLTKLVHFNAVSAISLVLQLAIVHIGISMISTKPLAMNAFVVVGIVCGSMTNFYFYNRFIWKHNAQ